MIWGRRTPLDDAVMAAWDAAQSGTHILPNDVDPSDLSMIEAFLALDVIPGPSTHFQKELERRLWETSTLEAVLLPSPGFLKGLEKRSQKTSFPAMTESIRIPRANGPSVDSARRSLKISHRSMSLAVALAVLVVLVGTGLIVLFLTNSSPPEPPAIPAAAVPMPTLEPLVQFDFESPPWGMADPTTWDHMEAVFMEVLPGESFTTDFGWFTDVDGPLLITVFSGELAVTPGGPALLFTAGNPQSPQDVAPGQTVLLAPNDSIVYSAADGANATNLGTESVNGLYGLVGKMYPTVPDANTLPAGIALTSIYGIDGVPPLPASGASVSIERLELAPFDSFVYTFEQGMRFVPLADWSAVTALRKFDGVLDGIPLAPQSGTRVNGRSDFLYPPAEPQTFVNFGDSTIVIYFLVVEPYPNSTDSTPIP